MNKKNAPSHTFTAPAAPGDSVWWARETATGGPGPVLVQAAESPGAITAVQFDKDGFHIVTDDGVDEPGGEYSCLDEAACLSWIKEHMPDAILMDGRTVKAWFTNGDGVGHGIDLRCTVDGIEDLFDSSGLASAEPDKAGYFPIYLEAANKENSATATFVRNESGDPVDVLYGPMLLLRTERDSSGATVLVDVPVENVAVDQYAPPTEYDPDRWTDMSGMTVGQLRTFLNGFPDNAVVRCCGSDEVYWHVASDGGSLSVDCQDLADLPEYEGRRPSRPGGAE